MKYDLIGIYTRVGQSKQSCSSTLDVVKKFQVCISLCNLPGKGYIIIIIIIYSFKFPISKKNYGNIVSIQIIELLLINMSHESSLV